MTMESALSSELLSSTIHSQRILVHAEETIFEKHRTTGSSNKRGEHNRQFGRNPNAKQGSNARSPDIVFKGEWSTTLEGNHGTRHRPEEGRANRSRVGDIMRHINSIRHGNASRIVQQPLHVTNS